LSSCAFRASPLTLYVSAKDKLAGKEIQDILEVLQRRVLQWVYVQSQERAF
jgi:hypothetical protein